MPLKKSSQKVRVRFAPSPTGFLHIGSLRTALYNYLFARKHGGIFVLRIEDTDRARSVKGGVDNILKTLEWVGIEYDEGPTLTLSLPPEPPLGQGGKDQGSGGNRIVSPPLGGGVRGGVLLEEKGEYGPYVQSARLDIYKKYASELLKNGSAYICTCSSERLAKLREKQTDGKMPTKYDGHCRVKGPKVLKVPDVSNVLYVIRLKVPEQGSTKFLDMIRGEVEFQNALIDDQVLMKSDGYPTYHLANVVDDHLMKITHVIRGEEWLSSTPKHVLLYKAFGWKPPQFAHLPLLLNADHSKLSKRQGDVAVEDYIKKGYLREAIINFIATLGFNPRADKELYTIEELIAEFDLAKVNKSGAVVNFEKLDWMNGNYIRTKNTDDLVQVCVPYLVEAGWAEEIRNPKSEIRNMVKSIVALEQERMKKLSDIVAAAELFRVDQPEYEAEILAWKGKKVVGAGLAPARGGAQGPTLQNLQQLHMFIARYNGTWDATTLEREIKAWIAQKGTPVGETLWPMRVALSGREASPPPFEIAAILGKDKTIKRIRYAIELAKTL